MYCPERRLLLINPWIYDFAAYDYWLNPLGLLSVASVLRENGFSLSLIDCLDRYHPMMPSRIKGKSLRKDRKYGHGQFFKQEIKKPTSLASVPRRYSRYGIHPDILLHELNKFAVRPPQAILMTTMMTYWYPGTCATLELVKEVLPDTPVILGGVYPSLCPGHADTLGADYCVYGRGERKILEVLNEITGKGIEWMPEDTDMDSLPYPAFDLLGRLDYVCIQTSRGCPFRCTYCACHILNTGFIRQSPLRVVNEIEYWVKYHRVKNLAFYDDALLYKADEHLIPIMEGIIQRGINIFIHTPNGIHARYVNSKAARLMYKSGFKTLRLGYETADPIRQTGTGGKVNTGELEAAIACLKEAGFSASDIGVYVLIGLPGQEAAEVMEGIEMVASLGGVPVLTEFSPIPGTAVWEEAVKNSHFDLAEDPVFHNNSIFPCQWAGFSWEEYLRIKTYADKVRKGICQQDLQ